MKIHQKAISTLLLTALSTPVFAERLVNPESGYNNDYISITGFLGSRIDLDYDDGTDINDPDDGARFAQAIALNWSYKENSEGELLFSNSVRSSGDTDIYLQYLHFGGRILFQDISPFSTSIALGVGGTHILPDDDDYSSAYAFSASAAVGMRYQLNQHFALRSDFRVYGTLLREGHTESFCSGEDCADGYLIEAELLAGIEYKF
ncbi:MULTISPECIES: outer membrane beta-barrel protein [unclassified Psychromonas]|uniref:outer membrane beta-barrel protein n=1 Tax=unclassified Psychromonas TaxID=2614957 RepID=UPI0015F04C2E|nr:outer membrane beta-barrel protein [Psychromonas sp. B3M02]